MNTQEKWLFLDIMSKLINTNGCPASDKCSSFGTEEMKLAPGSLPHLMWLNVQMNNKGKTRWIICWTNPNLLDSNPHPVLLFAGFFCTCLVSYRDRMHERCRCITKVPNHPELTETRSPLDKPGDLVFAATCIFTTEGGQKHSAMT